MLPSYPWSIFSARAISLTEAYRLSPSNRFHRNARASAFSSVGSAVVAG
jgi:hypothetical protein